MQLSETRYEKGYGFLRPALKMGVGNGMFWSEIGSGFRGLGGTPPPRIPMTEYPLPRIIVFYATNTCRLSREMKQVCQLAVSSTESITSGML